MATYAWTINELYTENVTKDGTTYTDVIARLVATLTATSEVDSSIKDYTSWDIDLDTDNIGSDFIAYDSVTESEVISWLETRIGTDELNSVKQGMVQQITYSEKVGGAALKVDTDGNPTFPWS
jgi:hypothetical protein